MNDFYPQRLCLYTQLGILKALQQQHKRLSNATKMYNEKMLFYPSDSYKPHI